MYELNHNVSMQMLKHMQLLKCMTCIHLQILRMHHLSWYFDALLHKDVCTQKNQQTTHVM